MKICACGISAVDCTYHKPVVTEYDSIEIKFSTIYNVATGETTTFEYDTDLGWVAKRVTPRKP